MISVVIRNKNEATALKDCLELLRAVYKDDIDEIILVDNLSNDNSIAVAKEYGCRIITIENFSYGRAINMGIEAAANSCVLLLSSHAAPMGKSFFKNSLEVFKTDSRVAGIRYINSIENYKRAVRNRFQIEDGTSFGLMAACAMVNKEVWKEHKFDEDLIASEDKEWSKRVLEVGFKLFDLNETYTYFANRDKSGQLKRWEIETLAEYQIKGKKYPGYGKIFIAFLYKILVRNPLKLFEMLVTDVRKLRRSFSMKKMLDKHRKDSK